MINAGYVCHRLIDDIVKRGGNQISDRFIVKKCLKKFVLSNKKIISNELIKQTGIKSQLCTIQPDFEDQPEPPLIKKDQYMAKSVKKTQAKIRSKANTTTRGKSMSISKINNKKQVIRNAQTDKKFEMNQNFPIKQPNKTKKQNYLIQLQQCKKKPITELQIKQLSLIDSMRQYIIQKQKKAKEQALRIQQQKRNIEIANLKSKKDFEKQLNDGPHNNFTYHTDGKYIVYSLKNSDKVLNNNYPISMNSVVKLGEKNKKKNVKAIDNLMTSRQIQHKQLKDTNEVSNDLRIKSSIDLKSQIYSNNNQRQTTSLNFFKAKPGVSFTQPSCGKTVRADIQNNSSSTFQRNKKSNFSKFLTEDTNRTKLNNFFNIKKQQEVSKISIISKPCKTQYYQQSQDQRSFMVLSRRPKTTNVTGRMINVNQTLLSKLISNL